MQQKERRTSRRGNKVKHHGRQSGWQTKLLEKRRDRCKWTLYPREQQDQAISVGQPGGEVITSRCNCDLKIKNLPNNAQKGHVLPGLHTSLLLVGKFCDEGCITIFTKDKVH
eukprot:881723-Ditylum_brightwellii.AAC.1